jgi:hypothetical protein
MNNNINVIWNSKLIMKTVPVDDEDDLYQIRYTGASNFTFNGDICEKKIRI